MGDVAPFEHARVGDHAYTWERADGGDFGEYRFETADDPRGLYDDDFPVIRKRWELVEVVNLPIEEREGE
jgi:hypothetical protein